jgi:hypothetical protein
MTRFCYSYHGLNVSSELRLPEWSLFEKTEPKTYPDVLISVDRTQSVETPAARVGEYRFFAEGAGWFSVKRGREIAIAPCTGHITRRLRLFLTGSAWGALLYQRGILPIHASAVQTDAGALMFCGRRGQGKSTMAAFLADRGYKLISDDMCCISMSNMDFPLIFPSVPRFKLWNDSIRELGWNPKDPKRDPQRVDKFHYFRPSMAVNTPLPVAAICLLGWGSPRLGSLGGFTALHRFLNAATWRGDLLLAAGFPSKHFGTCAELVRRIPVWDLRRSREFSALPETFELIKRQLIDTTQVPAVPKG